MNRYNGAGPVHFFPDINNEFQSGEKSAADFYKEMGDLLLTPGWAFVFFITGLSCLTACICRVRSSCPPGIRGYCQRQLTRPALR